MEDFMSNNNMSFWDRVKTPPTDALKKIQGGRLRGFTDINPQFRYRVLTEVYGPYGIGWKYTVDKKWSEPGPEGVVMCFADISLFVKYPDESATTEWCDPIPGHGGSMLVAMEAGGLHASDEGYKMAVTDALSVACKMVGIGSEVYEGKIDGDKRPIGTKYDNSPEYDQSRGENQRRPLTTQSQPRGATRPPSRPTTGAPTPRSAQGQAPTQPQTQNPNAVPGAGTVNKELKTRRPTMTDKERATAGLLIGKYINILSKEITEKKIPAEKWKLWLQACYGYPSLYAVKLEAYQGILKTVRDQPDQIINFSVESQRQPGEDGAPTPTDNDLPY
jgi:hypothetical protein